MTLVDSGNSGDEQTPLVRLHKTKAENTFAQAHPLLLAPPCVAAQKLISTECIKTHFFAKCMAACPCSKQTPRKSSKKATDAQGKKPQMLTTPRWAAPAHPTTHHQVTPCQPGSLCQSNNSTLVPKQHHQTLGKHCSPPRACAGCGRATTNTGQRQQLKMAAQGPPHTCCFAVSKPNHCSRVSKDLCKSLGCPRQAQGVAG
jgi:hypothetical protein